MARLSVTSSPEVVGLLQAVVVTCFMPKPKQIRSEPDVKIAEQRLENGEYLFHCVCVLGFIR